MLRSIWNCFRRRIDLIPPKVITTIGRLPETLADRCILIRMQRKTAEERCERLRDFDGAELQRKCARFVLAKSTASYFFKFAGFNGCRAASIRGVHVAL